MNLIGVKSDHIFTHICERDIDLLFIEEFFCNHRFLEFFLSLLSIDIDLTQPIDVNVWHSVSGLGKTKGETDIELFINNNNKKYLILLENKIDTDFQSRQFERYQERAAEKKIQQKDLDEIRIVLICPKEYIIKKNNSFQYTIFYEKICGFFKQEIEDNSISDESKRRFNHKIEVMKTAIFRCRRGYLAVPCNEAKSFYQKLNDYITDKYPKFKINLHNQKVIPKDTMFVPITFIDKSDAHYSIPIKMQLKFRDDRKTKKPRIDLELKGLGFYLEDFKNEFKNTLYEDMNIKKAGKSLAISYSFNNTDIKKDFDLQLDNITYALDKGYLLKQWYIENCDKLKKFVQKFSMVS